MIDRNEAIAKRCSLLSNDNVKDCWMHHIGKGIGSWFNSNMSIVIYKMMSRKQISRFNFWLLLVNRIMHERDQIVKLMDWFSQRIPRLRRLRRLGQILSLRVWLWLAWLVSNRLIVLLVDGRV